MAMIQKLWRRLQYVKKNETVCNFACSEFSGGCGVSDLESPEKKRKEFKHMDESRDDAAVSCGRTEIYLCGILAQPIVHADVHGSFRRCF